MGKSRYYMNSMWTEAQGHNEFFPLTFARKEFCVSIVQENPTQRHKVPQCTRGHCSQRPGWSSAALSDALVGRSHRSKPGKAKLQEVINLSKEILGIPKDYRLGIVPGSDTGAVEMALWSLLGQRGVDVL